MKNINTDLAVESKEFVSKSEEISGVISCEYSEGNYDITQIEIKSNEASKKLSKDIGTYITLDLKDVTKISDIEEITDVLKKCLCKLFPQKEIKSAIIIGLGNRELTPDALGPLTTDNTLVTRHLRSVLPDYFENQSFNTVSALSPSVIAKTGIETVEIIKSIVEKISPDIVVVVDALASKGVERLINTIQMSNTGLCPGGGVGNKRKEISKKTVGVDVLSIGVPTVVDMASLSYDILSIIKDSDIDFHYKIISDYLNTNNNNFIVSVKDIDEVITKLSKILGYSINMFLHKNLSFEEMESFLS